MIICSACGSRILRSRKLQKVSSSTVGLRHLLDGAWKSMETGALQLKAAAEAYRVNIDFVDGDKLQRELEKPDGGNVLKDKVETSRFGPTPLLSSGEAEPVEPR